MIATSRDPASIGAHFSTAGGLCRALDEAARRRSRTAQIFTASPRQWAAAPLDSTQADAFTARMRAERIVVASHAAYLINLAAADPQTRRRALDAFAAECARCARLALPLLVIHPGSATDRPEQAALALVAHGIDDALERSGNTATTVLIETTAGQGRCIGHRFEHLAAILAASSRPARLGICLDTSHVFAAGYDLSTDEGYARTFDAFGKTVGLDRIRLFHVNDSVTRLGSRVDRHAHIGKGLLGAAAFRRLLTDPRFRNVPACLETADDDARRQDFRILRAMLRPRPAAAVRRRTLANPASGIEDRP